MLIHLTQIPNSGFCREPNKKTCPYLVDEGNRVDYRCKLYDFLDLKYTQERLSDNSVISNICPWSKSLTV